LATYSNLYLPISRINHSCDPNVQHSWNSLLQREVIYAIKNIAKGDQIVTSYIDPLRDPSKSARQNRLSEDYKFVCDCPKCSLKETQLNDDDERSRELKALYDEIPVLAQSGKMKQALQCVDKFLNNQPLPASII